MDRIKRITENPLFTETIDKIEELEQNRIYCRHGFSHLMDVARAAYILVLENNINVSKEIVYAAALLHDIGRAEEAENGVDHRIAGLTIAKEILSSSDFSESEREQILSCVSDHGADSKNDLLWAISRADHDTRMCFRCAAIDTCKWKQDELNMNIKI